MATATTVVVGAVAVENGGGSDWVSVPPCTERDPALVAVDSAAAESAPVDPPAATPTPSNAASRGTAAPGQAKDVGLMQATTERLSQLLRAAGGGDTAAVVECMVLLRERFSGGRAKVARAGRQMAAQDGFKLVAAAIHRHGASNGAVANAAYRVLRAGMKCGTRVAEKAKPLLLGPLVLGRACELATAHSEDAASLGGILAYISTAVAHFGSEATDAPLVTGAALLRVCVRTLRDHPRDESLCADAARVLNAATAAWRGTADAHRAAAEAAAADGDVTVVSPTVLAGGASAGVAGGEESKCAGAVAPGLEAAAAGIDVVVSTHTLCVLFAAAHVNPSYRLLLSLLHIVADVTHLAPAPRVSAAFKSASAVAELAQLLVRICATFTTTGAATGADGGGKAPLASALDVDKAEARRMAPILAQALWCLADCAACGAADEHLTPGTTVAGVASAKGKDTSGALARDVGVAFFALYKTGDIASFHVALAALQRLLSVGGVPRWLEMDPAAVTEGDAGVAPVVEEHALGFLRCLRSSLVALNRHVAGAGSLDVPGTRDSVAALHAAVTLAHTYAGCLEPVTSPTRAPQPVTSADVGSALRAVRDTCATAERTLARALHGGRRQRSRSGSASSCGEAAAPSASALGIPTHLRADWPTSMRRRSWDRTPCRVGDLAGDMGEWDLVLSPGLDAGASGSDGFSGAPATATGNRRAPSLSVSSASTGAGGEDDAVVVEASPAGGAGAGAGGWVDGGSDGEGTGSGRAGRSPVPQQCTIM